MKVIYPDNVIAIWADEANANFPAVNLTDNHPKKVWKATSRDAVVTVAVSSGSALGLVNTNASTVTVASHEAQTAVWGGGVNWGETVEWWSSTVASFTNTYDLDENDVGRLWSEYTENTAPHWIDITLTAPVGATLYAGTIQAGTLNTFNDPAYGVTEGLRDYSVYKELNNGAFYYLQRDMVRTFEFDFLDDRDSDFYIFMHTISQQVGLDPMMWLISKNLANWEWVVFARFASLPAGSHLHKTLTRINVKLTEVL